MADPVFIVTSVLRNDTLVQKPRAAATDPIEYETQTIYNIGINLQFPDNPGVKGPGFGFQTTTPEVWVLGAKFKLIPM